MCTGALKANRSAPHNQKYVSKEAVSKELRDLYRQSPAELVAGFRIILAGRLSQSAELTERMKVSAHRSMWLCRAALLLKASSQHPS